MKWSAGLGGGNSTVDVICGPTAAGKSAVAARLAARFPIAIISADSRQIYTGFDVGTAKPTPAERAAIPHYGIDVADPEARYSASTWAERAMHWMAAARAEGRRPVIVGGTGFYIRALVEPLFTEPPLDATRRAQLASEMDGLSTAELRRWCVELDPARARLGRTQLLRAIEIALLTGHRLSELHIEAARAGGLTARYLLLDPGAPALARRIDRRVASMIDAGWLEETKGLAARVPATAPAWNATGYQEIRRWAEGACTADEAIARVVISTRQYAKRQRTWFRNQLPADAVRVVNPDESRSSEMVDEWWASTEGENAA